MGCTNSKEQEFKQAQPPEFTSIPPKQSTSTPAPTPTNAVPDIPSPVDVKTSDTPPTTKQDTVVQNTHNSSSNSSQNNTKSQQTAAASQATQQQQVQFQTPTKQSPPTEIVEDEEASDLDMVLSQSLSPSTSNLGTSPRKSLPSFQEPPIDMTAELIPDTRRFSEVYELGEEIGQGAFSTVRLGINRETKEKCAVKCISKQRIPPEDEAALKQEVIILRALNHPNILKCYGFFDENEFYYLVMEYMAGGELFDRIVQKTFYSEKEARDVVYILLSTIHYCHTRNIVHRDLKPENLLLSNSHDDAFIKLADFGFAISSQGFSTLKTQCGTPGYVAPEILSTQPYGKAVDMWSIGVITYILLGGYPPFYDDNQKVLFEKIKRGEYSFHPEYWDAVSVEAKDLISRLLKVNPLERYTSEEALNHSWITRDAGELAQRSLEANLSHFKKFHATRKFKAAARAIISINRMRIGTKKSDT